MTRSPNPLSYIYRLVAIDNNNDDGGVLMVVPLVLKVGNMVNALVRGGTSVLVVPLVGMCGISNSVDKIIFNEPATLVELLDATVGNKDGDGVSRKGPVDELAVVPFVLTRCDRVDELLDEGNPILLVVTGGVNSLVNELALNRYVTFVVATYGGLVTIGISIDDLLVGGVGLLVLPLVMKGSDKDNKILPCGLLTS